MNSVNLSQHLDIRIILACLESVKRVEEDDFHKKRLDTVIKGLGQTREKKAMNILANPQKHIYQILMESYDVIRKSFIQLSKEGDYSKIIGKTFALDDFLLNLQPNLKFPKENLTIDLIINKYTVQLTLKFKEHYPAISKEFVQKWIKKSKEKIKQQPRKKPEQPYSWEKIENIVKEQYIQKKKQRQKQKQKQKQKQRQKQRQKDPSASQQEDDNSEESFNRPSLKNKQKSAFQLQKQAKEKQKQKQRQVRERENQKENERQMRAQRDQQERRREDDRRRRQQNQRRLDAKQLVKMAKGRASLIQKYIDSRKDLGFERGKNKEVSEYLASKLDQFLKNTIEQLYDIACLKNKKNAKFGNQLGYFAQDTQRVQNYSDFYFQPNTKISTLSYKRKHELYSLLRMKEIKKQDELRTALETKTNQGQKKLDKRIENYILKPRSKQTQALLGPYREQKESSIRVQSVTISLQHVIYFLQNHTWLKNSLLLFNVYHRF